MSGDILFGLLFSRSCPCALLNTIITESVLTKIYILSNTIKNRPREAKGSEKTEVRSQRAEVRRQRSEDRKQKTEDRGQKSEVRRQKAEGWKIRGLAKHLHFQTSNLLKKGVEG